MHTHGQEGDGAQPLQQGEDELELLAAISERLMCKALTP